MRRRTLIKALAAAPLTHAGVTRAAGGSTVPLPAIGAPFPLVDVPLLDGGVYRAAQANGRVLVVYWWASWCPFCAIQTPSIQRLWDAQRTRGLDVLGLSVDARVADATGYLRKNGFTFPSGFVGRDIEPTLTKPGVGLPTTCVRDRGGRVALADAGQMFAEDVERIAQLV